MSFNLERQIPHADSGEYQCIAHLNLYDSPGCTRLATQSVIGRHLRVISINQSDQELAAQVCLCEDDYPGWLAIADLDLLKPATLAYQAQSLSTDEITQLLPQVIAFTQKAMQQTNYYLWGGTVGPNYDCSGLIQSAFAAVGIWLPRDAYQQEGFTQPIAMHELRTGDLVFFGSLKKATHVGLYLGNNSYIHSSGQEIGRNGIGIDILSPAGDTVSQRYYQQLRGAGRVVKSYQPRQQ
jgi:cell wall-associated NlpC family hydrolase